jgi:negative regulator of sigma E activity
MTRISVLAAVGFVLVSVADAQAPMKLTQQQEVPSVLRRAVENAPNQRYVGTRVMEFRRDGQLQRHTEIITRSGPRTRIEFPEGSSFSGQIIVETEDERRHFFPDRNEIRVLQPRREEAFGRLVKMIESSDRFRFSTEAGQSVAGVSTEQVVVRDRAGNLLQRIFIEPRTGALLKRQMYDAVGTHVGGFEFTKINLDPRIRSEVFRIHRRGATILRPLDILRKTASEKDFGFAFLPASAGYVLDMSRVSRIEGEDVLMQFYTGSNGRVTLFQLKSSVSKDRLERYSRGDVKVHSWTSRGETFVLVGQQDLSNLQRLARLVVHGT